MTNYHNPGDRTMRFSRVRTATYFTVYTVLRQKEMRYLTFASLYGLYSQAERKLGVLSSALPVFPRLPEEGVRPRSLFARDAAAPEASFDVEAVKLNHGR